MVQHAKRCTCRECREEYIRDLWLDLIDDQEEAVAAYEHVIEDGLNMDVLQRMSLLAVQLPVTRLSDLFGCFGSALSLHIEDVCDDGSGEALEEMSEGDKRKEFVEQIMNFVQRALEQHVSEEIEEEQDV